jgi:hypothetical protein
MFDYKNKICSQRINPLSYEWSKRLYGHLIFLRYEWSIPIDAEQISFSLSLSLST